MELERKTLPFTLKADGPEGSFRAVFATFDVVDHDGDVTRPGAFKTGSPVIVGSWGHKAEELPVGKGVIQSDGREAAVEGAFFLDTTPGRDTYQTVKNLDVLGEWSYLYVPEKVSFGTFQDRDVRFLEQIKVFSVDPVLAGAGIDTRTTNIKGLTRDLPFVDHTGRIAVEVAEYVERVKERLAVRVKEGRVLSAANVERLGVLAESLRAAVGDLEKLRASAEPKHAELVREFLRYQRLIAGLAPAGVRP